MLEYKAKHLAAAESHEGVDQVFAVIAAAGGPSIAELQDRKISESAEVRAEVEDAFTQHGDILPAEAGWTVSLATPIGKVEKLALREPTGRDLQNPGWTA